MACKDRRRSILLVILQAWILPCHGFTFIPHYGLVNRASPTVAVQAVVRGATATLSGSAVVACRATVSSRSGGYRLSMSDSDRVSYDDFDDDYPAGARDGQVRLTGMWGYERPEGSS